MGPSKAAQQVDGRDAWIGLHGRVTVESVQFGMAAAKILIDAACSLLVGALQRCLQSGGIDAELACQLLCAASMGDVSARHMGAEIANARIDVTEAIFANEPAIADQPGGNDAVAVVRAVHGFDEVMVGIGFVAKAAAGAVHGDHARLGAIQHEMRKEAACAVFPAGDGDRRPDSTAAIFAGVDARA